MPKFKPQYRRLLYIDSKIREGRFPNCSSLAEAWETSTRTIQRDVDYLKYELEAPLEYDAIRHGFFYTDPAWFLPSVLLSEGDLLALLIGRQAMEAYRGTPLGGELQRIYAKLAELLPERVAIGPEFVQTRMSFFNPPARRVDPEIWRTVLRALMHTFELEIGYRAPAVTAAKAHRIRPYHVVNVEGEWYLLAFVERWQELRQFAMSRIRSAQLTKTRFAIPGDFNVARTLENRFGRYLHANKRHTPVPVRLLIEKQLAGYIAEKEWHPKQRLRTRRDGRVELTLPVADTLDIESWILSLGEFVRVLSPRALQQKIAARHRAAARF